MARFVEHCVALYVALESRNLAQETHVRGCWIDPSAGLMWTPKDNGEGVSWKKDV
jgi:hypothetical protein